MKKIIKRIGFSLGIFLVSLFLFGGFIGCCTFSGSDYEGEVSDHFDGEEFFNQGNVEMKSGWDMLQWAFEREPGEWPDWIKSETGPPPPERVGIGELRITFVNHSTVLIQMDSLNILTDPVWSYRISPVDFAGPTRKRASGLKFEDLPPIDYVLVSHNHYDHMDIPTLEMLKEKHDPVFIVSLGNKAFMFDNGMKKTFEMDWWDEMIMGEDSKLTFVPAQHFSMRGICDRNKTLWGGFIIDSKGGPVYFAGDTGFGIHFEQIYNKFGSMRFSMLPIGAFVPKKFVAPVHTSPMEAVEAHKILKSQWSMGIHWGTFRQADDGLREPIEALKEALKKESLTSKDFSIFEHGRGYMIPGLGEVTAEAK
ncbi:MBL fold metallo-hydrolase [Bacteroidota bacterium]